MHQSKFLQNSTRFYKVLQIQYVLYFQGFKDIKYEISCVMKVIRVLILEGHEVHEGPEGAEGSEGVEQDILGHISFYLHLH